MPSREGRIEVYDEPGHPYPWRFRIWFRGKLHQYAGTPNQCATKRAAIARAAWRLKWFREGTYHLHYGPFP